MDVLVLQKQVPDVVEDLPIAADGKGLDPDGVVYVTNELDQHALEQALILKERHGGRVDVFAIGGEEALDSLAEVLAKGADGALHVSVGPSDRMDNVRLSAHVASILKDRRYDLILSGVQAVDDFNGNLGGLLAGRLRWPYVGGLAGLTVDPSRRIAAVRKEYPGGVLAAMEVSLPAVLGIQSAERPPRYVPVARVMQAKRTMKVPKAPGAPSGPSGLTIARLFKPEPKRRAEMLEGDADAVAGRIAALLKERGLI